MYRSNKPQLKAEDFALTFEAYGVSPFFQESVCIGYMPIHSIELASNNRSAYYVSSEALQKITGKGKEFFKDEAQVLAQISRMDALLDEADAEMARERESITPEESIAVFALMDAIHDAYSLFDTVYTDAAYAEAGGMTPALLLTEANKNRLRARYDTHINSFEHGFVAPLAVIARMHNVSIKDLCLCLRSEVVGLLEGKGIPCEKIEKRKKAYVFHKDEDGITFLEGDDALALFEEFTGVHAPSAASEIQGITANKGPKVRGRVAIINSDYGNTAHLMRARMEAMKQGDILVSITTAPDLMEACNKAAAIVTDLGGMLSHAAITARELGIPCIVGTKSASKVLKDGDLIEIDSEKGTVTLIEQV